MVNQEEVAQFQVDEDGRFSGTIDLVSGVNRVSFKCFDASLNPSGSTEPVLVHADLNAPYVTSSIPGPGQVGVPVTEVVSLTVSEGLVESSINARLEFASTGVSVPVNVAYSSVTKTISIAPVNHLEEGETYRVVVDGMDPAGNHLTGEVLEFTTVEPEEPPPTIGGSFVYLLLALVVVAVAVVAFLWVRQREQPPVDEKSDPGWEPGPTERPEARPEYDPRTAESREMYEGEDWDEY
jgi:hypothetical protein